MCEHPHDQVRLAVLCKSLYGLVGVVGRREGAGNGRKGRCWASKPSPAHARVLVVYTVKFEERPVWLYSLPLLGKNLFPPDHPKGIHNNFNSAILSVGIEKFYTLTCPYRFSLYLIIKKTYRGNQLV